MDSTGGSMEASLAEMYLSHMLQLEDPSEALATLRRLEVKQSMQSDKTLLLGSQPGDTPNGGKLKVGALLYAKVLNVLLRTNRTEDASALIPIIEAKNLTCESKRVIELPLSSTFSTIVLISITYPGFEICLSDLQYQLLVIFFFLLLLSQWGPATSISS